MVTAGIYARGLKLINNYFCTVHDIDPQSPTGYCYATNAEFGVMNNSNCIGTNGGTDFFGNLINVFCASSDDTADDFAGVSNIINQDPATDIRYVSSATGNMHIQTGSTCQNTGDAVPFLLFDVDNNPRPSGSGWDRGADEIQERPPSHAKKDSCCCGCGKTHYLFDTHIPCQRCFK